MTLAPCASPPPAAVVNRRRVERRRPDGDEPISHARLRAGHDLSVLSVSTLGALVEGSARLLPGTHVDLHIVTRTGRVLVRSRVVRAFVSEVRRDALRYRGALVFERAIDDAPAHAPASVGIGEPG